MIRIKNHEKSVIQITRKALDHKKIVYVAVSDKTYRHPNSKSKIVYIGQTEKAGAGRVASSAAYRAGKLMEKGVKFNTLEFFVISLKSKQGHVSPQKDLERDLLKVFKQMYGAVPIGNTQGKNYNHNNLSEKFNPEKLKSIIYLFG